MPARSRDGRHLLSRLHLRASSHRTTSTSRAFQHTRDHIQHRHTSRRARTLQRQSHSQTRQRVYTPAHRPLVTGAGPDPRTTALVHASRPSSPSVHRLDCAQRRADPATCISEKETIRPRPRLQVPLRNPHGAFELKVVSIPRYSPESRPVTAPTMAAWPSPMNEGQTRTARLRTRASKEGDYRIPERAPGCVRAASPCPCHPIPSHVPGCSGAPTIRPCTVHVKVSSWRWTIRCAYT